MLVKIINVSTFHGKFVNSTNVHFLNLSNNEESTIEISGELTKDNNITTLGNLRADDVIRIDFSVGKEEEPANE